MKRRLTESERFVVDVWKRKQKNMLKHDDEIQQGATRKTTKPKKDKKTFKENYVSIRVQTILTWSDPDMARSWRSTAPRPKI